MQEMMGPFLGSVCVPAVCHGTVAARQGVERMGRVTVGYQDACVYPLWLSRVNLRLARLMGAAAVWLPDHFMSFTPAEVWRPGVTGAARVVPSLDALFDPLQLLAITATRIRGVDVGTSVTEAGGRRDAPIHSAPGTAVFSTWCRRASPPSRSTAPQPP
jgi:hypothetical protein